MLAEGDFPPDLEASDVSFSVHQQNGEETAQGQGRKKESGHDSSVQGDPKNMRQVSMLPTDAAAHNYIVNGHFLVCLTQQSFSCRRSTSCNAQQAQVCYREMLSLPVSIESLDMRTMLVEDDFPPDLEASDVPFSVHQQHGEEKASGKEEQDGQDERSEVENETTVFLFSEHCLPTTGAGPGWLEGRSC